MAEQQSLDPIVQIARANPQLSARTSEPTGNVMLDTVRNLSTAMSSPRVSSAQAESLYQTEQKIMQVWQDMMGVWRNA